MKKTLLSCIAILLCISIHAQQTVDLRMNLEKGRDYRLKSVSEQTITQTVNGVQQTTEANVNFTLSLRMIDATSDFMITEIHFDTLMNKTNTMGKTTIMSSVDEGNIKSDQVADILSCIMNRLSKNAIYVKMDFTGKPVEIVNSKMLAGMIMKDTSSITLTGQSAADIKKQIADLVSDKTLKTNIEMFTRFLPGKPVAVGDSWNESVEMSSGGMMLNIATTYHLDGINGGNANISAESNIKAAKNADPIESGGATVRYDDLKGLSRSNMVIDIRTGLIVEDKTKTHIAGNLGISAPGFSMQMPMDIVGESKVIVLQ